MILNPSIFLIESPLQLFNAIEAKNYFNLKNCKLIVVYSLNDYSNTQIDQLLDYYSNWNEIYKIFPIEKKYFRIRITKYIIDELKKISEVIKNVYYLFIGDYRPDFMIHFGNIVKCNKLIILDDGTATIDIMKDYLNVDKKRKLKFFLKKYLFDFKLNKNNDVEFFSIYSNLLLNHKIIHNSYQYFREETIARSINENKVIFLGSCIVELRAIEQDKYFLYLSKIKEYFSNKEIIYIPHRRESELKLELIENEMNIKIEKTASIIELYLIKTKNLPFAVTGFFCSALLNLNILFDGKILINSFYINNDDFNEKYAKRFESMYKYYKNNLEIVDNY
ncbi:hypothetical protein [Flavobacterium adhaerens]|uniref:hypothetical protein n=1 Tax=Flavobacterium adhaerens TaxID=3149043 RepID=UPI0032B3866D